MQPQSTEPKKTSEMSREERDAQWQNMRFVFFMLQKDGRKLLDLGPENKGYSRAEAKRLYPKWEKANEGQFNRMEQVSFERFESNQELYKDADTQAINVAQAVANVE